MNINKLILVTTLLCTVGMSYAGNKSETYICIENNSKNIVTLKTLNIDNYDWANYNRPDHNLNVSISPGQMICEKEDTNKHAKNVGFNITVGNNDTSQRLQAIYSKDIFSMNYHISGWSISPNSPLEGSDYTVGDFYMGKSCPKPYKPINVDHDPGCSLFIIK